MPDDEDANPMYPSGASKSLGNEGTETKRYLPHYRDVMRATGMSEKHIHAIRMGVSKIESGGNYSLPTSKGQSNFGRYQYNMRDVEETAKMLGEEPPTYAQLIKDPNLQEKYYAGYLKYWDNYLTRNSQAYRDASPEKKAYALAAAQMGGHSKDWIEGKSDFRDSAGTHINTWPNTVAQYLGDKPPSDIKGREDPSSVNPDTASGAGPPGQTAGPQERPRTLLGGGDVDYTTPFNMPNITGPNIRLPRIGGVAAQIAKRSFAQGE